MTHLESFVPVIACFSCYCFKELDMNEVIYLVETDSITKETATEVFLEALDPHWTHSMTIFRYFVAVPLDRFPTNLHRNLASCSETLLHAPNFQRTRIAASITMYWYTPVAHRIMMQRQHVDNDGLGPVKRVDTL